MEDVLRGPFSATITPVVQRHCVLSNTGLLCLKANWSLGNPFAIIPARLKVVLIKEAIKLWKKRRNYLPKFINLFSFWEIEAIRCKKLPGSLISHSLPPSKNSKLALIRMEREVRGPAAHLSRRTITSVSSLTDRHLTGLKCGGLGCFCAGRETCTGLKGSLNFVTLCQTLWTLLDWREIHPTTRSWPEAQLQTMHVWFKSRWWFETVNPDKSKV